MPRNIFKYGMYMYLYICTYVCTDKYTRWFKYDRDYLCVNKSQFVPVIFEPPCTLRIRYNLSESPQNHCDLQRKIIQLSITIQNKQLKRAYRHSTYGGHARVETWASQNFYTCGQLYMYVQGIPAEVKTPTLEPVWVVTPCRWMSNSEVSNKPLTQ
jgi:hypothetical protein